MNEKDIEILAQNGWEVECESPLEISTHDGSFATNEAARIVLEMLKGQAAEEEVLEVKIVKAKQLLYGLMFERGDWASMHDVVFDLTNVSLMQEGLETIFDQLPDNIQFDAFKWGLSDTEVSESIHKYLKDNELHIK